MRNITSVAHFDAVGRGHPPHQILTLAGTLLSVCRKARFPGQSLAHAGLTVIATKEGEMSRDRSFKDMVIAIRPKLMEVAFNRTQSKVESEDIVSKTVLKMLEHEDQFMPGSNFAAWAVTITKNVFVTGVLRAKPHVPLQLTGSDGEVFDRPELAMHTAPMQESGIIAREMAAEVAKLPRVQQDALKRAVHDGQEYDQIALETKVSKGTVKSRISRARSTLNNTEARLQSIKSLA